MLMGSFIQATLIVILVTAHSTKTQMEEKDEGGTRKGIKRGSQRSPSLKVIL